MSENNSNFKNIELFLSRHFDFAYNEITNKLSYKRKSQTQYAELKEYDVNSILRELKAAGYQKVMKKDLADLLNSDFTPIYNPFQNYFYSLSPWKEGDEDFIEALSMTVDVPEHERENWKKWFKKWMVGVVACALDKDKINQTAIIFVGEQGIGKTTWMKKLVPEKLEKYYYGGSINPGNKDSEIHLSENLFINLDELENLNKKNITALKESMTKPSIKIRRPYGTHAENMPRRASFMGSVNNREFLRDETGNRRFLCFETQEIKYDEKIDLDMVYAQAYYLYKNDFRYWFNREEILEVNTHNENYKVVTLEQEILTRFFEPVVGNQKPDLQLETEELIDNIYSRSDLAKRLSPKILGSALTQLNWPKKKTGGRRYWLLKTKL